MKLSRRHGIVFPIALAIVVASVGAAGGCATGLTTQEAYEACEELESAASDASFDACVACFEDCSDCEAVGTTPETYRCPTEAEQATTGSSVSASSSSGG